jgi:hypothetical protein
MCFWDVDASIFSRQSANRWRWGYQPYASAGRPLPPGRFLVLISVRGWVYPRAIVMNDKLQRMLKKNVACFNVLSHHSLWWTEENPTKDFSHDKLCHWQYWNHSFIHQWLYSPLLGLGRFFSFLILNIRYDSLDGGSARRKAATYTQDNTNRIIAHTNIHASSGIRTHDPSVRASEDSLCLKARPHYSCSCSCSSGFYLCS